jgi:hypothetical protein
MLKDHSIAELYIAIPSAIHTISKRMEVFILTFPVLPCVWSLTWSFGDGLLELPKDFLSFTWSLVLMNGRQIFEEGKIENSRTVLLDFPFLSAFVVMLCPIKFHCCRVLF